MTHPLRGGLGSYVDKPPHKSVSFVIWLQFCAKHVHRTAAPSLMKSVWHVSYCARHGGHCLVVTTSLSLRSWPGGSCKRLIFLHFSKAEWLPQTLISLRWPSALSLLPVYASGWPQIITPHFDKVHWTLHSSTQASIEFTVRPPPGILVSGTGGSFRKESLLLGKEF